MGSADGTAMWEGSTAAAFEKSRLFKYIIITSRACYIQYVSLIIIRVVVPHHHQSGGVSSQQTDCRWESIMDKYTSL